LLAILVLGADPGADALPILQDKCFACHGAQVKTPGGGLVLEGGKIPGPRLLNLVKLVGSNNMPPNDSPTGRLAPEQKTALLLWAAQGAPAPAKPAGAVAAPVPAPVPLPETFTFWQHVLAMIGNLHILLVHFPIVLVLCAAGAEFWGLRSRDPRATFLSKFCLIAAACFALPVAATGWVHAWEGYGSTQPMNLLLHRWLGTGVATGIVLLALVEEWVMREVSWFRFPLIVIGALLVIVTAHLGGMLSHGANFLSW
jgi:uncharacterized membrane protein